MKTAELGEYELCCGAVSLTLYGRLPPLADLVECLELTAPLPRPLLAARLLLASVAAIDECGVLSLERHSSTGQAGVVVARDLESSQVVHLHSASDGPQLRSNLAAVEQRLLLSSHGSIDSTEAAHHTASGAREQS